MKVIFRTKSSTTVTGGVHTGKYLMKSEGMLLNLDWALCTGNVLVLSQLCRQTWFTPGRATGVLILRQDT